MNKSHGLGAWGERTAARQLTRRGLRVLAKNTRIQGVEVDLIAYDPSTDELVVVEVKTTGNGSDGSRRISTSQRRRLARATQVLSNYNRVRAEAISIDGSQLPRYRSFATRISMLFITSMSSLIHRFRSDAR